MKCNINGAYYEFAKGFQDNPHMRDSLNTLASNTFDGLSFSEWYFQGFWNEKCVPYSLFFEGQCVSNVFVNHIDIVVRNKPLHCVQLSTVMTDAAFKTLGLSRFLLEYALRDLSSECELIFLYANDSVVDFYPKFKFEQFYEYQHHMSVVGTPGIVQKLNIDNPYDRQLLFDKYVLGNPFSLMCAPNNIELLMFHCLTFQKENIFYLPDFDLIAICETRGNTLFCHDIFCDERELNLTHILSVLCGNTCTNAILGFTPTPATGFKCKLLREHDTHLFVLCGGKNVFEHGKLRLPVLYRT